MKPARIQETKADWHAVERDFRAGILSLREMAKVHGVSHNRIAVFARENGWERDLIGKINAKADAIVHRRELQERGIEYKRAARAEKLVSREVELSMTVQDDQSTISGSAELVADVRMRHRHDIRRAHDLSSALLAELEAQTFDAAMLSELGELMRSPDDAGMDRLNDIYKKVISTPGRVDTAKKLIESMKTVIGMEREAYNIGTDAGVAIGNSLTEFLAGMKRSALPVVIDIAGDDY